MVITWRAAAITQLFGMALIMTMLGLLSFYFIIVFFVSIAFHFNMFWSSLQMDNNRDPVYVRESSLEMRYQGAPSNNSNSNNDPRS